MTAISPAGYAFAPAVFGRLRGDAPGRLPSAAGAALLGRATVFQRQEVTRV